MRTLNAGLGKQFKLAGKIPSQFMVQYFYNVVKPTGAPDSALRFTFQMAFQSERVRAGGRGGPPGLDLTRFLKHHCRIT